MEHMAHLHFVVSHSKEANYQKQRVRSDRKICTDNKNNQRMNSIYRASMDMKLHILHIIYLLKIIKHRQNPQIMLQQNKHSDKKQHSKFFSLE